MIDILHGLGSWINENILNIVGLTFVLTFLTLLGTIVSAIFAKKAHDHQIAMIEPWTMRKVGQSRWLLERNIPTIATILYFLIRLPDGKETVIKVENSETKQIYKKGRNYVIDTSNFSLVGTRFELGYEDYRSEKQAIAYTCCCDLLTLDLKSNPPHKVWNTSLY